MNIIGRMIAGLVTWVVRLGGIILIWAAVVLIGNLFLHEFFGVKLLGFEVILIITLLFAGAVSVFQKNFG